jgi:hypothetical protein
VVGAKLANVLGFQPDRGVMEAVLDIWDALERGQFGDAPECDPLLFNSRWLQQHLAA